MSNEKDLFFSPGPEDENKPSFQELTQAVIKKILKQFHLKRLTPEGFEAVAAEVGMAAVFDDRDFSLTPSEFIEKNLFLHSSLIPSAIEELSELYPLNKKTKKFLKKMTSVISPEEEAWIRRECLQAWLKEEDTNLAFKELKEQSLTANADFVEMALQEVKQVQQDEGIEDVEEIGIVSPSEVMRRYSFMDVFSSLPFAMQVENDSYLAFFSPEDTMRTDMFDSLAGDGFTPEEIADYGSGEYDRDEDEEEVEPSDVNVDNPEDYFVILEKVVAEYILEKLFSEDKYRPIVKALVAYYLIFNQMGYLDSVQEFFSQISAEKSKEAVLNFEYENEELYEQFWSLLEKALQLEVESVKKNTIEVIWQIRFDDEELRVYKLKFQKESHDAIQIQVSGIDTDSLETVSVGNIIIHKQQNGSWYFNDEDTQVGYYPNDEIRENIINITELIVNDFVQQFVIEEPQFEYQLLAHSDEIAYTFQLLNSCEDFQSLMNTHSDLGIKSSLGHKNSFILETHNKKREKTRFLLKVRPSGDPEQN